MACGHRRELRRCYPQQNPRRDHHHLEPGRRASLRYTAAEAIGKPITLVIPEDRHHEEDGILRRLRAGERIDHFETVRRRKDGGLIEVPLTVSPVRNEAGQILGASKIARDITAQKRAAAQQSIMIRSFMVQQQMIALADMEKVSGHGISSSLA
ncbi:PAS domain-containing protein [Shinella sp. G-2]|uniref:PAS domain-containing protein n=1 Tax=Shinella sp. G-2 TaxID=3133141 RepID=UPI003D095206